MTNLVQQLQQTYDEFPYHSYCFRLSSPEHLATVAHLFGLDSPPVATARVLELGCAAGGNLVPFVSRHPQASALGIDLSPVQIEAGRQCIDHLGMDNIELRQGDLSALDPAELGRFDYIICHGVYSWVPEHVRQAILRICKQCLAPDGIAYVSYNTYPGWKGREILRDAMLLRAERCPGFASEKLAYGRGMIDFLQRWADPKGVLGVAMDRYAPLIRESSEHYLVHEYLEHCNAPCYFRDFVALAAEQGLGYLAEAEPRGMFIDNYPADVREALLKECGHSQVLLEQYLDFLTDRTFRQTLLVHEERAGSVNYSIEPERLRDLNLAASLKSQDDEQVENRRFVARDGQVLTVSSPLVAMAIEELSRVWPRTVTVDTLLAKGRMQLKALPEDAEQQLLHLLELMVIKGMGRYSLHPVSGSTTTAGKLKVDPRAIAYATANGGSEGRSTFNCWHEPVVLDAVLDFLLPRLDGRHTRRQLLDALVVETREGRLHFSRAGVPITDKNELAAEILRHLQHVLIAMVA